MNNNSALRFVFDRLPKSFPVRCLKPVVLACFWPLWLHAGFAPLPLATNSFNCDIIVEHSAPAPVIQVTTASMDTGWTNTGYSWYQRGYMPDWPATGLPAPGGVVTSDLAVDHLYQLAPDYRTNNVALVDATTPVAELRPLTPVVCSRVSVLLSGMHNAGLGALGYSVVHEDGSVENGTVSCPDWLQSGYAAYSAEGRVHVNNFTFAQINGGVPKMFTADIALTNTSSAVTRVVFTHVGGVRTAVFALSKSGQNGEPFDPVPVYGFNADIIVEASAAYPRWLGGVTTASMETGTANTLRTWVERGYVPGKPGTGLPAAGSILTNLSAPDHLYSMAPTYEGNNAILLDAEVRMADLNLSVPASVRAVSFLTASFNGPMTNQCVARYADGSAVTNAFASPDWQSQSMAAAWLAHGRVNLNNRIIDYPAGDGPWLFGADVSLPNASSPLTNLSIGLLNPAAGARVVIFAVSGDSGQSQPEPAVLTIRFDSDNLITIESAQPGTLESTSDPGLLNAVWINEGPIQGSRTVQPSSSARFWRVKH